MKAALLVLVMVLSLPLLAKEEKTESKWAKTLREKLVSQQTKSFTR